MLACARRQCYDKGMSDKGPVSINITTGTVVTFFGVGLLLWLLFFLKDLVLIILTAVVLSSALEPAVAWFMRYKEIGRAHV